jgi:hypothetical protein
MENLGTMKIDEIARAIRKDWGSKVNFAARPYLEAMGDLAEVTDRYMADSAASIVRYFLCNASSWRGPVAKEIKAELNRRVKGVY